MDPAENSSHSCCESQPATNGPYGPWCPMSRVDFFKGGDRIPCGQRTRRCYFRWSGSTVGKKKRGSRLGRETRRFGTLVESWEGNSLKKRPKSNKLCRHTGPRLGCQAYIQKSGYTITGAITFSNICSLFKRAGRSKTVFIAKCLGLRESSTRIYIDCKLQLYFTMYSSISTWKTAHTDVP